jgi:hypothetical protein
MSHNEFLEANKPAPILSASVHVHVSFRKGYNNVSTDVSPELEAKGTLWRSRGFPAWRKLSVASVECQESAV